MLARILVCACISTLLFAGCATPGKDSFGTARELEKQQRYEDALSVYEEAVTMEPGNPEYRAALNSIRSLLASQILENAKKQINKLRYNRQIKLNL